VSGPARLELLDRIPYCPFPGRPRLRWPDDARLAFWVIPNVEYYEFQPAHDRTGRSGLPHPDVPGYATRDYGNRVGFWRMLDVLDRHRIRCTVNINLAVLEHFPEIRDAMLARNWDFCFHGFYNTQPEPRGLTEDQERAFYRRAIDTFGSLTGRRMSGVNVLSRATAHTPDLLAEAGFLYHADWMHDDQPTPVAVRRGRLVSVPYSMELNDALFVMFQRPWEGDEFVQMAKDQFDRLYAEGAHDGRVMCVVLHPWVIGYPHRIRALDEILAYVRRHDGVWHATAAEIAEHYLANGYDAMQAHLARVAAATSSGTPR
jgi:peptidoglycan/xylan/chitin deacetylase (PgdA/CDA1 family)